MITPGVMSSLRAHLEYANQHVTDSIHHRFFKQARNLPAEHGKVSFNDTPDNLIRDRCIPMDEPVAEGYNPVGTADSKTKSWISVACLVECFPNYPKLAFNSRSDQRVVTVSFKCHSPW